MEVARAEPPRGNDVVGSMSEGREDPRKEPLWRGTAHRAEAWMTALGASGYVERVVRFGIRVLPTVMFRDGVVLGEIPQSAEDREFGKEDLKRVVRDGMYEMVGTEEVGELEDVE